MPNPVATDLDTMRALFVSVVEALEPRYVRDQLQTWRHFDRRQEPGVTARVFRIVWDADFETPDGIMFPTMVDTTVPVELETSYGGFPDQVSRHVADSDNSQLREALHALQHTTPGIITIRKDDPPWEFGAENNGDQSQINHRLLVRYWKRR